MQFSVPQYIQVKQRIIGPLTLYQFLWLAGGFFLSFLCFLRFKFWLSFPLALIFMSASACFALIEINGQPLLKIFGYFIKYQLNPHIYFWQREKETEEIAIKQTRLELEKGLALKQLAKKLLFAPRLPKKKEETTYQVFRGKYGERKIGKRVDYL